MTITITQLYQLLSKKLNQETAEALTTYISEYVTENIKEEVDTKVKTLATKEDLAQTKLDLIKWLVSLFVTLALMIIGLYLK